MSKVKKVGGIVLLTVASLTANSAMAATPYDGVYLTDNGEKVDWQQLARSGQVKYVLIKATEGDNEVSNRYENQLAEAKKCGLKVGSYHVLRSSSSIDAQFENFKSVADRNSQDIIPVVAVELIGGLSANKLVENVKEFAKKVEAYYGCVPMISTSSSFYNKYLSGSGLSCPLMISSYGNEEPELTDGAEWWMWECSDDEQVDGCDEPLVVTRLASDRSLGDFALNHRAEAKAPKPAKEVVQAKPAEKKELKLTKPAATTAETATLVHEKPVRKKDYTRHAVSITDDSKTGKTEKPIKADKHARGSKNEKAAKAEVTEMEMPETQEVDFQSPSKFSSVINQRRAKAELERQKKDRERLKKEQEREKKLKKEQEKARKQAEKEEKARLKKEKQQQEAELKRKRDAATANSEREQRIKEAKTRNEQLQKGKKEAEPKAAKVTTSAKTGDAAVPSGRSTRRIRSKSKVAPSDSVKVRERIYEVDDEKMKQPVRKHKKKK